MQKFYSFKLKKKQTQYRLFHGQSNNYLLLLLKDLLKKIKQ